MRYLFGYHHGMSAARLLHSARVQAGLSQRALAQRAAASQPTLCQYEAGHKSPRFDVAERIAEAAGFQLALVPTITWTTRLTRRGRPFDVPDHLPQLPPEQALARVALPLLVYWSEPGTVWDLSQRKERLHAYEILLREGTAADIERFVDGALLADGWDEMVVSPEVRAAWQPLIDRVRGAA
jgi:transcriptional regulator with XRE-family HTH domain